MVNKNYEKRKLIKKMLSNGNTYKEIMIKLKCSRQLISSVQKELSNESNLSQIIEKAKKDCWSLTKSEFYILKKAFYNLMNSEGINLDNQDLAYAWNEFNPYFYCYDDRSDIIKKLKDKYNWDWDYQRETKYNSNFHILHPVGISKREIDKEINKNKLEPIIEKAIKDCWSLTKSEFYILRGIYYANMNSDGYGFYNIDIAFAWNNFNPNFCNNDLKEEYIHKLKVKYEYDWDNDSELKTLSNYYSKKEFLTEKREQNEKAIDNLPKITKEDKERLKSLLVKIRRDKKEEDDSNE